MANITQYILKWLWLVPALSLVACVDNVALSTKYYYVKPESKAWLVHDSLIGVPYEMVDNNDITYNFTGVHTSHGFSEGMSGFLFVNTKKSYCENYHSTSISNYGTSFSTYLYASYISDKDDEIHFYLTDISVHCTLFSHEITYFGCDNNHAEWTQTEKNSTTKVIVNAKKLDTLTVRHRTYREVLHVSLNDPIGAIKPNQCTDIYYAKGVGLISYKIKSGIVFERH
ncbi:MAG TPA: hypothetical protein PLJ40_03920 [Paludibacteraceae bacterium]|nr:hypothetical protein [Paludibacteraceae bacterium]HQB69557.1 hypothetical protein [Paludibacteraceae bacterium]HRS67523.1 hypothetical protein [Paludibacteraceae bacterium]